MKRFCVDASAFLRLEDTGALSALGSLVGCAFVATDVVWREVTTPKHTRGPRAAAILSKLTTVERLDLVPGMPEMARFDALRKSYCAGRSSPGTGSTASSSLPTACRARSSMTRPPA
jgi:hypothetical protein